MAFFLSQSKLRKLSRVDYFLIFGLLQMADVESHSFKVQDSTSIPNFVDTVLCLKDFDRVMCLTLHGCRWFTFINDKGDVVTVQHKVRQSTEHPNGVFDCRRRTGR